MALRYVAYHLGQRLGRAVGGQHDHAVRSRPLPALLGQRHGVRADRHPLQGQERGDRESAAGCSPEAGGKTQVDGGVGQPEHQPRHAWPPQAAAQRQVGQRESGNHEQRQVVHVLVRTEHQRGGHRQCEVQARLVRPPAQGDRHQRQEPDQDREGDHLSASGQDLEDVAQRVDGCVRVDGLAVSRQLPADRPRADRAHVFEHRVQTEACDGHDCQAQHSPRESGHGTP